MLYPREVLHAFDYFIWSALDDINLLPTETRPFNDEERHYNRVLNAHLFPREVKHRDMAGDAAEMWARSPLEASYMPYYFPDDFSYESRTRALSPVKGAYLANLVEIRVDSLETFAKSGWRLDEHAGDSRCHLVQPDGYLGYYARLREEGTLFANATPYERERACFESKQTAVAPWGTAIEDETGWFACPSAIIKKVLPDFVEAAAA